jgi:hypothetical protein
VVENIEGISNASAISQISFADILEQKVGVYSILQSIDSIHTGNTINNL